MKRITPYYIYTLMTGVFLSISGCDDSYPHDNQSLTPSMTARYLHCGESKIDFEYTASSRTMSVESVNTPWSLSCAADWLNIPRSREAQMQALMYL